MEHSQKTMLSTDFQNRILKLPESTFDQKQLVEYIGLEIEKNIDR